MRKTRKIKTREKIKKKMRNKDNYKVRINSEYIIYNE